MNKKSKCILILLLSFVLCSCSRQIQTQDVEHGSLSEMAQLHLFTVAEPDEEYAEAAVSASWTNESLLKVPAEIKLRGNSTKESEKKSYNIKFQEAVPFIGMDPGKKWALVATPFDKSLLRTVIGFDYAAAIGLSYVPETRLCKVWLNDRYMGVYTVTEPVEAGSGRVEIDPDNGDFLLERNLERTEADKVYMVSSAGLRFEFNEPEEPAEQQQEQCYAMLQQAEQAIASGEHTEYEQYIDVDSFVNFYIFNEVIKDVDFGEYSTRYYFKDGILYAGPPWDLDLTQGNVSDKKEEFKYTSYGEQQLWADNKDYYYWLCQDPWFSMKVKQRWQALHDITANLTAEGGLLDDYLAAHKDVLAGNFTEAGWSVDQPEHVTEYQYPASDYMGNVELLRTWLEARIEYLDAQFSVSAWEIGTQQ